MTSTLFSPLKLRGIEFKNRIFLSPMCQYSAVNGMPQEWHLVHLGSRAAGGAALVIVEATAVSPAGRITPYDLGLWSDKHIPAFKRIASFIRAQGAIPGIQIAHAGRKGSADAPWRGGKHLAAAVGGWKTIAPSPLPFYGPPSKPAEMNLKNIEEVFSQFADATKRALEAGFEVIEIHMAHGYLLHEFLSPLSNIRKDEYGGSLENRARLPLRIAENVRNFWPGNFPVFVRISCTDWVEGGWEINQAVRLCRWFKETGIDLIDCSSGGLIADAVIPFKPGFQVPFAEAVRKGANISTGAVGLITEPAQAEAIIASGSADAVLLGREMLRNPYWPLQAAKALNADIEWPNQYLRAKPE